MQGAADPNRAAHIHSNAWSLRYRRFSDLNHPKTRRDLKLQPHGLYINTVPTVAAVIVSDGKDASVWDST